MILENEVWLYKITIRGRTDTIGTKAYNQELSEKRAKVVKDYLISLAPDS